jgi:UDP-N-acetyl-D-mannosaminuronic acid dehydrogenase
VPPASVAVIGLGYIGLPTAAILATNGLDVVGVDVNDHHVEAVNRGQVPFVEPDLATHVAGAVSQGRLRAQKEMSEADIFIVAVPTPFKDGYDADLSYIEAATDAIVPNLRGGELIILESTSPPGTTRHIADRVLRQRPDLSLDGSEGRPLVHFAHCPERVLPGRVMIELVTNDRIIGGLTPEAAQRAREVYSVFCDAELHVTDATTAELAKLTENSYRDVNIAFANELSVISDRLGVDVFELVDLANRHPRVNILQPGPGVGGHCIAVDPWFIVSVAPQEARLIRTAREVNDGKPDFVLAKVAEKVARLRSPVVAVLGLAFKPDIDDLRESPALDIARGIAEGHPEVELLAVEPNIDTLPPALASCENVTLEDVHDAVRRADLVVLLVDHREFKELPKVLLTEKSVIDTRGVWR